MTKYMLLISCAFGAILAGSGARAATADATAAGQAGATVVGDIVVTAERKEENLQATPVAVSAFTDSMLKARRLDGGENLEQAIPNVNYSRSNFGGFSLEIRGVGDQAVGGAEPGVSINENFIPLFANHFADTDFYDTQRVEVERGPQGTLFGRSATVGAVNIITNQPTSTYAASITGEYGAFNEGKVNGFVNLPLGDMFAVRLAGLYLSRDGVGTNTFTGQSVDGRDLWSGRVTVSFKPTDKFRAYLMYEHFSESDDRNTVGKQLCTPDPGPTSVGGVATTPTEQGFLSQGCQNASLYTPAAYGVTNSSADLAGIYAQELGLLNGNGDAGHPLQDTNLHDIASPRNPLNKTHEDFVNLDMSWDVADNLKLESITGYNANTYFYQRDYNRFVSNVQFGATPATGCLFCISTTLVPGGGGLTVGQYYTNVLYPTLFPGGVVTDGQTGNANSLRIYDQGDGNSTEWTQELRFSSSFSGPLNFSVGALYYNLTSFAQYNVFFNPLTGLEQVANALGLSSFHIDQNNPPNASGPNVGHNYYLNSYTLTTTSYAGFGEVYYDITPTLKITGGLRETDDRKSYTQAFPVLFATQPAAGGLFYQPTEYSNTPATTGRIILSWTPQTSFSDHTMLYVSYSRGYKAPGFNTACGSQTVACSYPLSYAPEYDSSYEIGTKNTFDGGKLTVDLTGFYTQYQGYQIATTVAKSAVNQNINANIYGMELESVWSPVHDLTFNAQVGYLHTQITGGDVLDQINLTQGNPNLVVVKASDGSNCVVTASGMAALLTSINTTTVGGFPGAYIPGVQEATLIGVPASTTQVGVCGGAYGSAAVPNAYGTKSASLTGIDPLGLYAYTPGENVQTVGGVGQGVEASLRGNRLPNAPDWTLSIGAQYVWELPRDWTATLRGDFYWQDYSYATIFNDAVDYLKAWDNVNATLTFASTPMGLNVQLFVKNAFNSQPITSTYPADPSAGLFSNTFTLDPRTYGVAVTKRF